MRATHFRLPFLSTLAMSVAALGMASSMEVASAQIPDLDLFVVEGTLSANVSLTLLETSTTYTLTTGSCLAAAPDYVDVPPDETGDCTGVTASGNVDIAACSTETISGSWQITEPASDTATLSGWGVMVGGVAVMAGGFQDGTVTGNAGALIGVFTPAPLPSLCGTGKDLDFKALVAGEY